MEIQAMRDRFLRFAASECQSAPLYRQLATYISQHDDLLALAQQAPAGQPAPNLFLAAVHYLLLQNTEQPLAAYYPTAGGHGRCDERLCALFHQFCRQQDGTLIDLMAKRQVQTNEVARAAVLYPGLRTAANLLDGRPLHVFEVGASAGLLLRWDRYAYDYGTGALCGWRQSLLRLTCPNKGAHLPANLGDPAPVVARMGFDLNPLYTEVPENVRWLRALVWPDHRQRARRLDQALGLAAADPPPLTAGDALELLPSQLAECRNEAVPCVFHAHTMNQFSIQLRREFWQLLRAASADRVILALSMEYPRILNRTGDDDPSPCLELRQFQGGYLTQRRLLARYEAHGRWLAWEPASI